MKNKLIQTKDGSHTIYQENLDEHYHSIHGAIQESKHVFVEKGFKYLDKAKTNILEIGLGTGLNALLTCMESDISHREVEYTGIEKYPVNLEMLNQLNYSKILGNNAELLFDKIHSAQWGRGETITSSFLLKKMVADFTDIEFEHLYDLVYFDAFAPDKQPEMWLLENFRKLYGCLNQNGVLVTYSAKGIIKRRLAEAGFSVSTISGPPGKREMIRAEKR